MIKFLFLTIPHQSSYDNLKSPLKFKEDTYGVTAWTMKHPLTIYSSDLKFKHVFKLNEVKVEPLSSPTSLEQKWRYFVMTRKDGGKYYCTSQIVYEKGLLKMSQSPLQSQFFSTYSNNPVVLSQEFYLPKCIVLVSEMPYFKLQVNLLKIHKELKKQDPAVSYCIEEDLYEMYLEYLEAGREKDWENLNLADLGSKRKTYCPLELTFSYYVECCNNHNSGECIYIEKATSRQVLHLYKLNPSSLYQIGYFFHLPLSAFSLRKLISSILTQKQIVFSSSNPNLTVMVIETLMQMIQPLKWCYMYAPNLPVELIEAAQESFMPFIVGISKQYLPLISKLNKIIVHIDTDEVETNFDQEEQELHLLSKKFERFLTCKANSNKQYLEWEKELRINSILMITTIFKKDMPFDKEHGNKKYFSEEQKITEQKFYEDFLSKSMMYRKLIEDVHQKVYSQFYKLTKMDFNDRKITLQNKFNSIHSQTLYPTKCDNKKEWIKYYQIYMRQKRKTRLNRHSLSMVEHNLVGVGNNNNVNFQPFYASNVSLNSIGSGTKIDSTPVLQNSQTLFQRNSTKQNSTAYRSNFSNARNNELYQSTVSSHSLNSHNSGMKFNMQAGGVNNSSSKDILQPQKNSSFNQNIEANFQKNHPFNASSTNSNTNNYNNIATRNIFLAGGPGTHQHNTTNQSNIFDSSFTSSQLHNMTQQTSIYNAQQSSMIQGVRNQNSLIHQTSPPHQPNVFSANKTGTYNSMIFNSPLQNNLTNQINNPLNQSMVTGYLHSNSQNVHNYSSMANFNNTASHRNLGNQNAFVL